MLCSRPPRPTACSCRRAGREIDPQLPHTLSERVRSIRTRIPRTRVITYAVFGPVARAPGCISPFCGLPEAFAPIGDANSPPGTGHAFDSGVARSLNRRAMLKRRRPTTRDCQSLCQVRNAGSHLRKSSTSRPVSSVKMTTFSVHCPWRAAGLLWPTCAVGIGRFAQL
jgi:hypothetical protein